MKDGWLLNANDSMAIAGLAEVSRDLVLIYYDEPQVLTSKGLDGLLYIEVAVDESDDGSEVRWLRSKISKTELQALLSRSATVYDLLIKPNVVAYDYNNITASITQAWQLRPEQIPISAQPTIDSYLPAEICDAYADRFSMPREETVFKIDGSKVRDGSINFNDLGVFLSSIQSVFTALAQSVWSIKSPRRSNILSNLRLAGTGTGSFTLKIEPEEPIAFRGAYAAYVELVNAREQGDALEIILRRYKPNVKKDYTSYLKVLQEHDLEIYTATPGGQPVFMSPTKARRIEQRLAAKAKSSTESRAAGTQICYGRLLGLSLKKLDFDFEDESNGETYTGKVEQGLLTSRLRERGIVVGSNQRYQAEIALERKGRGPRYLLRAIFPENDEAATQ